MNFFYRLRKLSKVIGYIKNQSAQISCKYNIAGFRLFFDMLYCYLKYGIWSNQYIKNQLFEKVDPEKKEICIKCGLSNKSRLIWENNAFKDRKFFTKYSTVKADSTRKKRRERQEAYKSKFNLEYPFYIGYDVIFDRHHFSTEKIKFGKGTFIGNSCVFDYSGGLIIKKNFECAEGVKILTHNHSFSQNTFEDDSKGFVPTPLVIDENVWLGARVLILPGVLKIGRHSVIGAGSVIRYSVPPYAIMVGNPAKITGFKFSPEEVIEFEKDRYSDDEKTDIKEYEKLYNKIFFEKNKEILRYLRPY